MEKIDPNRRVLDVLIVDDDGPFRLVLKEILSSTRQHTVVVCESGEKALEFLQRQAFDVVLLDYKMAGISGLNVLQWMHEQKMEIPVIMLTAAGSENIAVEAMKLGAYDYVRKENIDLHHVPVIVNGVYERYQFRKERERREMVERERSKSLVAIETFHSTLASLTQILDNSLSVASLNIEKYQSELTAHVKNEGRRDFEKAFKEIQQQFSVIQSAIKSMLRTANLLHGNFSDSKYTAQLEQNVNGTLKTAQQLVSASMGQKL
ncbi:MAG: response regulator [Ignavibacteriales bacterium]|nr:response regulator [Ignavibacteriales bacterium]